MSQVLMASENVQFDFLLEEVARNLQLTPTQFNDAEGKYKAVGNWLGADDSPITFFDPLIYPQGSMSLRTTVKPRAQDEFDLDLVCLMQIGANIDPDTVYGLVRDRLAAHETYKSLLEPKPRCLRLNYAGQFHLDIIPAIPDKNRRGTGVLIPARDLGVWKDSDPKAYVAWFDSQCNIVRRMLAKEAQIEPLPVDEEKQKACLRLSTQLLKRHRDIVFEDRRKAPSSIVLTTLMAQAYEGHALCSDALIAALDSITDGLEISGVPRIPNPVNPTENLTADWDDRFYRTFLAFVANFHDRMKALVRLQGLPQISAELEKLFGGSVAKKAIQEYMNNISTVRKEGTLRVSRLAATITTGMQGTRILSNTFHGE